MRVFRRRHSLGLLVLLAFAMQAALALAHVHVHYPPSSSEEMASRAITYGMCRVNAERPCPPHAPHDNHAKCSICLVVGLASVALLHAPPTLALPPLEFALLAVDQRTPAVRGVSSVHFQARAPPQV